MSTIQRSQSLHEQTYRVLRTNIFSGELAPNERLVETQLADRLQVSRTPIREAIRKLQQEGLVIADASGGLRVATLSIGDVIQLYDCRIALEQLSVAGACDRASTQEIEQLEQYVISAEKLARAKLVEPTELLELDYQFHHLIAESSGNKWLVSLLEQVFDKMFLLRLRTTNHNPEVLEIRQEHRQIYEAIAQRDAQSAKDTICGHLTNSKARVVRAVEILQTGQ
ncbi:GntR family transcriptional regulator [Tumidithrix elongata RA019]|uniref:GntR family transcriptional regulator n=1 Tax=Tumidithrix elongata BACA0141 TaxID=2716417 RepID=A0AAW9PW34_9CYAN|nr:GntR family transcriptional regulator [Tumidithrix elongata RA019]